MSEPARVEQLPPDPEGVRVAVRAGGGAPGYVDGAWWPRSTDLAAELPALLAAIGARVGHVERVAFDLAAWDEVGARRLATEDGRIPLEGFRSLEQATVWLVVRGHGRSRLGLMVIPPDFPPERADALLAGVETADGRSPSQLLAGTGAA